MKKELLKEEDNLLDDLDKIDNENKDGDTDPPADPPAPDGDETDPPEPKQTEVEKSIVELMVSGDEEAVKKAVHDHVVSVVAASINDVDTTTDEPEGDDKPAPDGDEATDK